MSSAISQNSATSSSDLDSYRHIKIHMARSLVPVRIANVGTWMNHDWITEEPSKNAHGIQIFKPVNMLLENPTGSNGAGTFLLWKFAGEVLTVPVFWAAVKSSCQRSCREKKDAQCEMKIACIYICHRLTVKGNSEGIHPGSTWH